MALYGLGTIIMHKSPSIYLGPPLWPWRYSLASLGSWVSRAHSNE